MDKPLKVNLKPWNKIKTKLAAGTARVENNQADQSKIEATYEQ